MKKITVKKIFLIVACLVFAAITIYSLQISYLQKNLISSSDLSQILASHTKTDYIDDILYGGNSLPYDKLSDSLFLPFLPDDDFALNDIDLYTHANAKIAFLDDGFFDDISLSIAQNKTATLIVYDSKNYCKYNVKFTPLPILKLQYTQKSEDNFTIDEYQNVEYQPIYNSFVHLFLPAAEQSSAKTATYNASYRLRGGSSLLLDKKNYKINLLDKKSKALDIPMLDMSSDNDWIAYSLYTDDTFVREKVISELWTQTALENKTRPMRSFEMQYIELFLNDEYSGIYSIMELVDKKLLELDSANDILYKCIGWNLPTDTEYQNNTQNQTIPYTDIEIKHAPQTLQENQWQYMQKYFDTFSMTPIEGSSIVSPQALSLADAEKISDVQNIIDYAIFESLFLLVDNNPKNTYYFTHNTQNRTIILKTFWDLNYSFGNIMSENVSERFTTTSDEYDKPFYNTELQCLFLGSDRDKTINLLFDRWQQLRKDTLTKENIFEKIDEYSALLISSGAIFRDEQRWGISHNYASEISRLKTFVEKRLLSLDRQFLQMKESE